MAAYERFGRGCVEEALQRAKQVAKSILELWQLPPGEIDALFNSGRNFLPDTPLCLPPERNSLSSRTLRWISSL